MTGQVKELWFKLFLLLNIYMLEASWQDRLDSSGGRKIYHTIPRIKRVQNFQQNTPINDDRSSILYDDYPFKTIKDRKTTLKLDWDVSDTQLLGIFGYTSQIKFIKVTPSEIIIKIIVSKRTALALDRIMVALQKALDVGKNNLNMKSYYPETASGLQRRGQEKGKVYWRCYFNAVTCF